MDAQRVSIMWFGYMLYIVEHYISLCENHALWGNMLFGNGISD